MFSEARQVAEDYECRFVETSAALHVNIDQLLVDVADHIALKLRPNAPSARTRGSPSRGRPQSPSSPARALKFLSKLFRHSLLRRRSSIDKVGAHLS